VAISAFGNTAGDGLHSEFLVAQKTEGLDQPGDCAQTDRAKARAVTSVSITTRKRPAPLDLDACGNLQRRLERAVLMVSDHSKAFVETGSREPRESLESLGQCHHFQLR